MQAFVSVAEPERVNRRLGDCFTGGMMALAVVVKMCQHESTHRPAPAMIGIKLAVEPKPSSVALVKPNTRVPAAAGMRALIVSSL